MAGTSLLAVIDDIATLLDDVGVLSKAAAKETVGVIGDDLAVNAEKVSGFRAERELPVVWAVAKVSAINKLILVPLALALSQFLPVVISPLLMLGGVFLSYEGFEKVAHYFKPPKKEGAPSQDVPPPALTEEELLALERKKVKGAIRTDFILSAEIVVISLGSVQDAPLGTQVAVMSLMAFCLTVGIYALVAGIVKIDDLGLHYIARGKAAFVKRLGQALLWFAPRFLKALTFVGTIAMFLVGGGILVHGLPFAHHFVHGVQLGVESLPTLGAFAGALLPGILNGVFGLLIGALTYGAIFSLGQLRSAKV
ncbi:MAG: DUF808 domain-containing protein [Polyangiaceae bacterium]|nr:DUF808 domain-containing protein [Polyangiaceae bacterium]